MQAIDKGVTEYHEFYRADLEKRIAAKKAAEKEQAEEDLRRLEADISASRLDTKEALVSSIDGEVGMAQEATHDCNKTAE
jgi:hypothetical protein